MFASPGRDHLSHLAVEAIRAAAASHHVDALAIGGDFGDGIQSTGYLSEQDLVRALQSRDLPILPYSDGVTGRRTSFFGALHVGCAVLTTLIEPMRDFPTDGAFQFTMPSNSRDFIATAVRICGDAGLVEELGRNGRLLFESELTGALLVRRVINVYEKALQ
jgi:glycosyltransferase involved in cell wall biosynthesis